MKTNEKETKKTKKYNKKEVKEFLAQSNYIEQEPSDEALEDAIAAWDYISGFKKINTDIILDVHRLLMKRLRPDIAGEWRECDVYIGGKRKIFISTQLISEDVKTALTNMGISSNLSDDVLDSFTKMCHIEFEEIHCFEDGNGRVGRILYNWHRQKLGLPIHVIHADWNLGGDEQINYYKWFK